MLARVSFVVVAAVLAIAGAVASLAAPRDDALPTVPAGFSIEIVAHVPGARELAAAANGDLIVGTSGSAVYVVPNAEGTPTAAHVFVRVDDAPAAGVALGHGNLFIGSQFAVWKVQYVAGDVRSREAPAKIARVRTSGESGAHSTTTVALSGDRLFASVGSSCNVCDPELDETRATIQEMNLDGSSMRAKAVRIRNAVALATDPKTGAVWAGVAGQDELPHGHPYEIFDPFSAHDGTPDYGWPYCYENRQAVDPHRSCAHQAVARVVFPAYETPIGAAFYAATHGAHAFGRGYDGGAFVALHGSWHSPPVAPRVVFVPMNGTQPAKPVDWADPTAQWRDFLGGFQLPDGSRIGRPTGVAVGPEGSLFVGDDKAGVIYRIRPRSGA